MSAGRTSGGRADLTVFDTERPLDFRREQSASKSRNSPLDGHDFRGGPVATIVAGRIVWTA